MIKYKGCCYGQSPVQSANRDSSFVANESHAATADSIGTILIIFLDNMIYVHLHWNHFVGDIVPYNISGSQDSQVRSRFCQVSKANVNVKQQVILLIFS